MSTLSSYNPPKDRGTKMTKNFNPQPTDFRGDEIVDRVLIGLVITISIFASACSAGGASNKQNLRDEGEKVFSSNPREQSGSVIRQAGTWAIVLESFAGEATQAAALARASALAAMLGRSDISVRSISSGSAVVLGSYRTYDTEAAQKDLRWIRTQRIGSAMPFMRAFLAPPRTVSDPGRLPELSLLQARLSFGSRAKYTLQIGAYESPDSAEAKRAAEQAVLGLRQDGTLAFYHHGVRRSMVTVGVFNDDDLGSNLQPSSPGLIALMKAFPHNLLNGQGVLERRQGNEQLQSSRLVLIPKQ